MHTGSSADARNATNIFFPYSEGTVMMNQEVSAPSDGLFSKIESWLQSLSNNRWSKKIQEDFEDLEKRNQKLLSASQVV